MLAGRVNGVTEATDGPDLFTTAGKLADLKQRYHEAVTASGEAAIEKQHAKGKMTARERIAELLDPARSSSSTNSCGTARTRSAWTPSAPTATPS
jgi:acetyl-CoA carboxylase carboxyltransferase component